MKVTLITSSDAGANRRVQRRVAAVARQARSHGAEIETLTLASLRSPQLRRLASTSDVLDFHTTRPPLALLADRVRTTHVVFTPAGSIQPFMRWPHARATRAALNRASRVVCSSQAELEALSRFCPQAARRMTVVRGGIDVREVYAASAYPRPAETILAVGALRRTTYFRPVVAAMASMGPEVELVVIGDGPARARLEAFAADLRVPDRVRFLRRGSEADWRRWLRTARVIVALSEQGDAAAQLSEGLAAGAVAVAVDIPLHREVAEWTGGAVAFVSPRPSPLDVADAITAALEMPPRPNPATVSSRLSWQATAEATWGVYESLAAGAAPAASVFEPGLGGFGVGPSLDVLPAQNRGSSRG